MEAVDGGHLEIARLLVDKGADVNAMSDKGHTALNVAIRMRRQGTEMVHLLLSNGAALSQCTGEPPLATAVRADRADLVKLLLEKGADPNKAKKALWLCVWAGRLEILRLLLDRGADPNSKGRHGRTLLMVAAARDQQVEPWYYKLPILLPWLIGRPAFGPVYDYSGDRDPEIVELLLEKGADVHAKDRDGWTALNRAERRGDMKVVNILKAHGARE
jgi:ankyrin repeat protein